MMYNFRMRFVLIQYINRRIDSTLSIDRISSIYFCDSEIQILFDDDIHGFCFSGKLLWKLLSSCDRLTVAKKVW